MRCVVLVEEGKKASRERCVRPGSLRESQGGGGVVAVKSLSSKWIFYWSTSTVPLGGGTAQLSAVSGISVADQEHATDAIAVLDAAIAKIDQQRADLGAISNRLSSVVDNNTSMVTNTESSRSHILDTDFAVETTKLTRTQILQQAATSMLAQANASKQSVLALLQNLG